MTIHDIAIRIDRHDSKNTKQFLKSLNDRAIKYIWFKEKKKKSGLLHYHGRLHIDSNILLESYEKKLRRELRAFYAGSKMINPWWIGKIESVYKYNRYIAKEKDCYKTNWSKEEINAILEDVKKINIEKKTPMKDQLLTAFQKTNLVTSDGCNTGKVYDFIINYHLERGYLPPTRSLLQQYAIYVTVKSGLSTARARVEYYDIV